MTRAEKVKAVQDAAQQLGGPHWGVLDTAKMSDAELSELYWALTGRPLLEVLDGGIGEPRQ